VTIKSKVIERLILQRCKVYLYTTDNQFGFKQNHSAIHCVYLLKEMIAQYTQLGGPVFVCFMDASKAFDRINHCTLFKKLLDRRVPTAIVKLLAAWYSSQKYHVRWNGKMSYGFLVSNGVRQGGILSPVFFNIYIHDLDVGLTSAKVGCGMNGMIINHLIYADDLCLICPSRKSLQSLLTTNPLSISAVTMLQTMILFGMRTKLSACHLFREILLCSNHRL